jgi:hypothetical protein
VNSTSFTIELAQKHVLAHHPDTHLLSLSVCLSTTILNPKKNHTYAFESTQKYTLSTINQQSLVCKEIMNLQTDAGAKTHCHILFHHACITKPNQKLPKT